MSRIIVVFDTSYGTTNIGDEIIMNSIQCYLNELIDKDTFVVKLPTHSPLSYTQKLLVKSSCYALLCGTNLVHTLYTPLKRNNPWQIGFSDLKYLKGKIILFGTGWLGRETSSLPFKYRLKSKFNNLTKYSNFMWKTILHPNALHSVRDSNAEKFVKSLGFKVVNTGCPTIWRLPLKIPESKSDSVITTVTDYNKDFEKDKFMLEVLLKFYRKVFIWPQGLGDIDYIKLLLSALKDGIHKVHVLSPRLQIYDEILSKTESLDYIGTRLHGGIRALQHGKRTLIIAVDKRAELFGKNFGIPYLPRYRIEQLSEYINNPINFDLKIDTVKIREFLYNLKILKSKC